MAVAQAVASVAPAAAQATASVALAAVHEAVPALASAMERGAASRDALESAPGAVPEASLKSVSSLLEQLAALKQQPEVVTASASQSARLWQVGTAIRRQLPRQRVRAADAP